MHALDEETLRAIVNLKGDPRFEKVVEWISKSEGDAKKVLHDNTQFNAGRVAELSDLLERIDTAEEKYRLLRK